MSFSGITQKYWHFDTTQRKKNYLEENVIWAYQVWSKLIEKCPSKIQDGRREVFFLSFQHPTAVISRASSWSPCFFFSSSIMNYIISENNHWSKLFNLTAGLRREADFFLPHGFLKFVEQPQNSQINYSEHIPSLPFNNINVSFALTVIRLTPYRCRRTETTYVLGGNFYRRDKKLFVLEAF